jgi:hypothetical protein
VIVSVNASYLTASRTFDDTRTFDLYSETASFTSDYSVEPSVGVDAGAIVRIWKGLGAGVSFTSYSDSRDIEIDASLPHPLKFNSPRTITGTAAGDHEETAVHLQFAYIVPIGAKVSMVIFGGPASSRSKQSVVTAVQRTEAYPFDEATFSRRDGGERGGVDERLSTSAPTSPGTSRRTSASAASSAISSATAGFSVGDVDAGGALVGGGLRQSEPSAPACGAATLNGSSHRSPRAAATLEVF